MSEPLRIGLRLLGLLLFLAGIAGVVALFEPGPSEIADWMGTTCDKNSRDLDPSEQCDAGDVLPDPARLAAPDPDRRGDGAGPSPRGQGAVHPGLQRGP